MSAPARVAIVTASTGIGAATARRLAARGWGVTIASRTPDNVDRLVGALSAEGTPAQGIAIDLTGPDAAEAVLAVCLGRFGRIDALFNVAGMSGRRFGDGPLHACSDEGWRKTLEINLDTQFRMCRAVIRHWLDVSGPASGPRGAVLNMSSVLGIDPAPDQFDTLAYGVSKSAIIGMSRILAARYLKDRIAVNVIAPGLVDTPMSARAASVPEVLDFVRHKQPLTGGMVRVEDAAELAAFMLDQGARSMTGQTVHPEGGWQLA